MSISREHKADDSIEKQREECEECGGDLRHDRQHAHAYCGQCGLVVEQADYYLSNGVRDSDNEEKFKDNNKLEHRYNTQSKLTQQGWDRQPSETTFSADGTDANDNPLPQYGADGRNLGISRKYQWEWHHGYRGDEGKTRIHDIFTTIEAFGDTLHVDSETKERAKWIGQRFDDLRRFNQYGGHYGFCLACLAVSDNHGIETEQELENRLQVREFEHHDGEKPLFKELAENHGIDWQKCISQIKKSVN